MKIRGWAKRERGEEREKKRKKREMKARQSGKQSLPTAGEQARGCEKNL